MPTRNINLTEHYDQFIREQIDAGRYRNASEVLRSGLRLLEQHTQEQDQKLQLLRSLAAQGIQQLDQGQGIELQGEHQLAARIARIGHRAATASKRKASAR